MYALIKITVKMSIHNNKQSKRKITDAITKMITSSNSTVTIQKSTSKSSQGVDPESFDELFFIDGLIHNCTLSGNEKTIVASPNKKDPDYYFEWIRDSALTVSMILDLLANPSIIDSTNIKYSDVEEILQNYVSNHKYFQDICISEPMCTDKIENTQITLSLGEPKMHTSCEPYKHRWGRPQNDGPALRAIAMAQYALFLSQHYGTNPAISKMNYIKKNLYDSKWPISHTIIKRDLEYVSKVYHENCFDLWEEITGLHFYTLMVQKRALIMGSYLAYSLGDHGAHSYYCDVIKQINKLLKRFYVHSNQLTDTGIKYRYIVSSMSSSADDYQCTRELDTSIILAYLHTDQDIDGAVLNTCAELIYRFNPNIKPGEHNQILVGRYPDDTYYGGNPWVITTAAVACIFALVGSGCCVVDETLMLSLSDKVFKILNMKSTLNGEIFKQKCTEFAISIFKTLMSIEIHNMNLDGSDTSFAEQIDKNTLKYVSAKELTWNYVEILRLIRALSQGHDE